MNIDEYRKLFPTEHVWPEKAGTPGVIEEGMLLFDETASYWAWPFEGHYAFYRLADMRDMPGWVRCLPRPSYDSNILQPPKPAPGHTVTIRTAGPK